MPILQIDSEKLKKGLRKLGVPAALVAAIVAYLLSIGPTPPKYLTYEEYRVLIDVYNQTVQEIKKDCKNDIRCKMMGGEPRVNFGRVRSRQGIINKLNVWVKRGPDVYKRTKK